VLRPWRDEDRLASLVPSEDGSVDEIRFDLVGVAWGKLALCDKRLRRFKRRVLK
jgi:hypothetical protein